MNGSVGSADRHDALNNCQDRVMSQRVIDGSLLVTAAGDPVTGVIDFERHPAYRPAKPWCQDSARALHGADGPLHTATNHEQAYGLPGSAAPYRRHR